MRKRNARFPATSLQQQITVSLAGLLIIMLSLTWFARQQTMPDGLRVGEWSVSGLSYEQFYSAFQHGLQSLENERVILYGAAGEAAQAPPLVTTLGQIGLHANVEAVIAQTRTLHTGSLISRALNRWFLRGKQIELQLMADHERLMHRVEHHWQSMLQREPVNATRTIGARDEVILTPDSPAFRIDSAHLQNELDRHVGRRFYAIVEAMSEWDPREMEPGEVRIELPLVILPADVTVQELEEQSIRGKIMEFSTRILPGGEGRLHNIRSTAAVVHDMLLAPGEVFDFAEVVSTTARLHGFREAPVILNGRLVPGIGGGICQVSTTLYNAAIRLGLEIVERRNHSLPISYAPLGQDATFSSGSINFRFRNSLSSHLLIRTETTAQRMTVKLFGTAEPGISYRIESTVKEILPPPVKYVHNPGLRKGEEVTILKGREGYVVETVRIRYKDGKPVQTERLSLDRYQPQPRVVAVNRPGAGQEQPRTAPQQPPKQPLIEDGVFAPLF